MSVSLVFRVDCNIFETCKKITFYVQNKKFLSSMFEVDLNLLEKLKKQAYYDEKIINLYMNENNYLKIKTCIYKLIKRTVLGNKYFICI